MASRAVSCLLVAFLMGALCVDQVTHTRTHTHTLTHTHTHTEGDREVTETEGTHKYGFGPSVRRHFDHMCGPVGDQNGQFCCILNFWILCLAICFLGFLQVESWYNCVNPCHGSMTFFCYGCCTDNAMCQECYE